MESATGGCPDEEVVLAFIHGQLPPERRSLVEEHLSRCPPCTDLATWAAADVAGTARTEGREGWSLASQLAPGTRVGRYQILGAIGRGGMGEVYAAYHPDLDRRIALKVVYGSGAADPKRQQHLLDEARIIARLDHPNIVTVHDAGVVGGRVYVAMEFVDGQTLTAWLAERERALAEILDAFAAAGRGLAAAHEAKVVHRDFKPQNVMIGRDGRVRVMDFGLARPLRELAPATTPATAGSSRAYATTSTTIGAFIGTPAYVAPEQLAGSSVDVRADQYSFCLALHEAVYGERPGASEKPPEVTAQRKSRERNVPPWLRAIIRRGLEPDREKRFESMPALLHAIERGRNRVRSGVLALGSSTVLLTIVALGWRASHTRQFACTPPHARIAAVWPADETPDSRRAAVHRALSASGLPDAETLWARVSSVLDDHVAQWVAMYKDTCEATHVRGEQSAEVLDLRMTCLSDNLDEVRGYTDALVGSGSGATSHAIPTANAITPVRTCADIKNLRLQVPLPQDPKTRAAVERLQQKIKEADALIAFKFVDTANSQLLTVVAEARAIGYKPVLAAALQRLGMAQAELLQHRLASNTEREALVIAEAAHDDLTAARAADTLASLANLVAHTDEAEVWLSFAEAVLDRVHARESLVGAWLLNERQNLDYTVGNFSSSEAHGRAAIALKRKLLGDTHPDVAISMCGLGQSLREMGRVDEARAVSRESIDILERLGDHDSLIFANDLLIEAEVLIKAHLLEEAEVDLKRALHLEQLNSATHGVLAAIALTDYGDLLIARHQPTEAVGLLTRAQAIWEESEIENPIWIADTRIALAEALVDSKATRSRATDLAYRACEAYAHNGWSHKVREITSWFNSLSHAPGSIPVTSCTGIPHASHS